MLVKVIHIDDFVRGRQSQYIFYGEVQEQPMQLQSGCVKFILSGLIGTYGRSNHRRQWSDEAMFFLQTNVKNCVWNCVITAKVMVHKILYVCMIKKISRSPI
jgi:hypothetical protein